MVRTQGPDQHDEIFYSELIIAEKKGDIKGEEKTEVSKVSQSDLRIKAEEKENEKLMKSWI